MGKWKEAAYEHPVLVAAELYYMKRPEKRRVRWRKLLAASLSGDGLFSLSSSAAAAPVPPDGWGRRKRRSSMVFVSDKPADKEEEMKAPGGRSSPTTPLSWNACELPDSPPEKKRRSAAGSVSKGGRGGGRGGGGSVKTAAELKELERDLLEKNVQLKKELEEQKLAKSLLVEENNRLQSLKAKVQQSQGAVATTSKTTEKTEAAKHDEELHPFPFDLNLPCPVDPDDGADYDQAG